MPTLITQDQFITEMIAHNQVHNIKMTSPATLGSYNQYVVPASQHMSIKASEMVHLELQDPRQTQLDITNSIISSKIQFGEGGWVDTLRITNNSKVGLLDNLAVIGGRVTDVIVNQSEVTEVNLSADVIFIFAGFMNSFKFHHSVSTKIQLTTLTLADEIVITNGNVDTVELVNIETPKKVLLDGVKNCKIINGKYHEIHITGPMTNFQMTSDVNRPFWRQQSGPPPGGALTPLSIEALTITTSPPGPLPTITTTGGNLSITGIAAGTKIVVKNSVVEWI